MDNIDSVFVEIKDFTQSFWNQCPKEIHYMEPFATFKKTNKKQSGKIMNAIYMIHDRKSKLYQSQPNLEDREKDVNKNYLGDENFDWDKYTDIIQAYQKFSMTWFQREVEQWRRQLEERRSFIDNLKYTNEDSARQKDEMLASSERLYEMYLNVRAKAYEELRQKRFEANYKLSPTEAFAKATSDS